MSLPMCFAPHRQSRNLPSVALDVEHSASPYSPSHLLSFLHLPTLHSIYFAAKICLSIPLASNFFFFFFFCSQTPAGPLICLYFAANR